MFVVKDIMIFVLVVVVNTSSNDSALCIFVHGLGQDWRDADEGIHSFEEEKHLLVSNDVRIWSHINLTAESYWNGLPDYMKEREICSNNIFLTKFDTVSSS